MRSLLVALVALVLFAAIVRAQDDGKETVFPVVPKRASGPELIATNLYAPSTGATWLVTSSQLRGGRQEGVHLLHVDNGRLRITLVPTRGMGILDVTYRSPDDAETRLGWRSPVTEIVNPAFMNLTARGGLGFLEGFSEFMCRCGRITHAPTVVALLKTWMMKKGT